MRSVAVLASRSSARALRPSCLLRLSSAPAWAPFEALSLTVRALATKPMSIVKAEESLDLNHLLTAGMWTQEELASVQKTHRPPEALVDKLAYGTIRFMRTSFDIFSGYKVKTAFGTMRERDWLRRVIFLETVAGVPGMVAGMIRHLHSLRLMRRDHGWIHTLLSEAENERMHLLIALNLRSPGPFFRAMVIGGQAVFLTYYTIAYLLSPRYCHRLVGYLEEEAVVTYTKLLEDIDSGKLPMFANLKAPLFARRYYNLPSDAMIRQVFECIRADEGCHRDTNHHLGDLKPDEPNTMVDHLRKGHFSHQNAFSGVARVTQKAKEKALMEHFKALDTDGNGYITKEEMKAGIHEWGEEITEQELMQIFDTADKDGDGKISYKDFSKLFAANTI